MNETLRIKIKCKDCKHSVKGWMLRCNKRGVCCYSSLDGEQTEPDYKQMWKALEKRVNSFTGFSEEWIRDEMRNCMKLAHDNTEIEKDCDNCDQSEECNSHIELWCPKLEKYVRLNHVCDD